VHLYANTRCSRPDDNENSNDKEGWEDIEDIKVNEAVEEVNNPEHRR
jgi:hypothetical protein